MWIEVWILGSFLFGLWLLLARNKHKHTRRFFTVESSRDSLSWKCSVNLTDLTHVNLNCKNLGISAHLLFSSQLQLALGSCANAALRRSAKVNFFPVVSKPRSSTRSETLGGDPVRLATVQICPSENPSMPRRIGQSWHRKISKPLFTAFFHLFSDPFSRSRSPF